MSIRITLLCALLLLNVFLFGRRFILYDREETTFLRKDRVEVAAPGGTSESGAIHVSKVFKMADGSQDTSGPRHIIEPPETKITNKNRFSAETHPAESATSLEWPVVEKSFDALLAEVEEAEQLGDFVTGFNLLSALKEQSIGEDLQTVLKKIAAYGEAGSQEILHTFASLQGLTEMERFRMLSYLETGHQLSYNDLTRLQNSYNLAQSAELRSVIIGTIARSGGRDEINWLIDRAENSADYSEWTLLVNSLSQTNSEFVLQYLHGYLDDLSAKGSLENETYRQSLREVIKAFQLKNTNNS